MLGVPPLPAAANGYSPSYPHLLSARYRLVFGDDFDDKDLSRFNEEAKATRSGSTAWRSRYRQPRKDIINNEKQIYVDPQFAGSGTQPLGIQPFSISDSRLTIRAQPIDPHRTAPVLWQQRYTSGCVTSELTHWQTYGYFEIRAKLPLGKGFWPAFWLLPKRPAWPPEIDIFEGSGARPNSLFCGLIEQQPVPPGANSGWLSLPATGRDGFRVIGLEWTASRIAWLVDGAPVFEVKNHRVHEDMYLLLNLAVGSGDPSWIPDPDASTPFPGEFVIDYVRAFKRVGAG